jgi:toxin YoeB
MNKFFFDSGWEHYEYWIEENQLKILQRINQLIKDIDRNGYKGIGKPEPLKHQLEGFWSRRIDNEHRLVYRIDSENIYILKCKGHYS